MKIAAAAYPVDWHNRWNEYVGKLRLWVRTAAEQGAELLVFPEYGAMELASLAGEENAKDLAKSIDAVGARIKDVDELHGSLAREFKVHICAASAPFRRPEGKPVNRARFFAPDGTFEYQDKLVPGPFERQDWGIGPGGPVRVFETALGRIGILLCEDAGFPEIARAMAAAGAEVLLVPSCTETVQAYWQVRIAAAARAVETQCVVVQAATVGEADWLPAADHNHGAGAIFGPPDAGFPDDGVIGAGKMGASGWVYGDVSLDAVRQARAEGSARIYAERDMLGDIGAVETVSLGAV